MKILKLLETVKEDDNEHKQAQLRQLALMTGNSWGGLFNRFNDGKCRICGGSGHPIWKCPDRTGEAWTPANVQCTICGECSHVTQDCKVWCLCLWCVSMSYYTFCL